MKEEIDEKTEFREDDMDEIIMGAGLGEEDIFFEDGEGLEPSLVGYKKKRKNPPTSLLNGIVQSRWGFMIEQDEQLVTALCALLEREGGKWHGTIYQLIDELELGVIKNMAEFRSRLKRCGVSFKISPSGEISFVNAILSSYPNSTMSKIKTFDENKGLKHFRSLTPIERRVS